MIYYERENKNWIEKIGEKWEKMRKWKSKGREMKTE